MRRWLLALMCVLFALGTGLFIQRSWLEAPANPTVEPSVPLSSEALATAEPPAISLTAEVESVEGVSELYDPGPGRWRSITQGEALANDAVLRTQRGTVLLRIGDNIKVTMSPFSQFRLNELTNRLSKVRLEQGLVTADVAASQEAELILQVLGSELEARTKDGAFSVLRSNGGHATIAGKRGKVDVRSAGSSVVLNEGQQSTVAPGEVPTPPTVIPGELIIKLTQGHARKLRYRSSRVEGETNPGAVVTVNGIQTTAPAGHFSVNVPLNEGSNSITVISRDALGREKKHVVTGIEVDTSPPPTKGRVQW